MGFNKKKKTQVSMVLQLHKSNWLSYTNLIELLIGKRSQTQLNNVIDSPD